MQTGYKVWAEFPKYEVGDDGSVWSTDYNHTSTRQQLREYFDQDGYKYVYLVVNATRYKRTVHRMVAISFISNPEGKAHVNHKNGVRYDNRVQNLEWCTPQENCIHSYKVNGRKPTEKQIMLASERFSGSANPKAKVNEAIVLSIRRLRAKGESLKAIAERHGISTSQVSAIALNRVWKNV